jgi:hypothetical protein
MEHRGRIYASGRGIKGGVAYDLGPELTPEGWRDGIYGIRDLPQALLSAVNAVDPALRERAVEVWFRYLICEHGGQTRAVIVGGAAAVEAAELLVERLRERGAVISQHQMHLRACGVRQSITAGHRRGAAAHIPHIDTIVQEDLSMARHHEPPRELDRGACSSSCSHPIA